MLRLNERPQLKLELSVHFAETRIVFAFIRNTTRSIKEELVDGMRPENIQKISLGSALNAILWFTLFMQNSIFDLKNLRAG